MAHLSKSKANNKMLRIKDVEVERPRRSLTLLPISPLSLIDGLSRTSLSYDKLPEKPLKLSVLKLDASCFYIEVVKTANVAELKLAVEAVFTDLPQKEQGKISWPHVWGHFCLCYNDQKLVEDAEFIKDYGIKDGDQLHFMRHDSITCNLVKKRPKKNGFVALKQNNNKSRVSRSISFDGRESRKLHHYADQGCFNEASLRKVGVSTRPSKVTAALLGGFKKIVRRCSEKWRPGRDSLRNTVSSKRYLVK